MVNRFVNALLCTRYNLSTYANLCQPVLALLLGYFICASAYLVTLLCASAFFSSTLLFYCIPYHCTYVCSFCTALEGAVALLINAADADNASLVDTEKGERVRTVDDGFQTRLMDSMYR